MKEATPKPDQELSREDRQNFHRLLIDLHDHYEPYHARKENVIWLATTVYLGGKGCS